MLRHVDLCSGIGGFALGFEWAGLSRPVMFCDIEPWSRKILAKHWPDVPIEEDVKVLANEPERIPEFSILTAGYPCQPFSHAGKRRGEEDDRHIWPYIREIVARKRPSWCVFENVYGHVSMGLDTVLSDLETDGYTARPFIVPACGVDAPHRRDRVWIIASNVANGSSEGLEGVKRSQHEGDRMRPSDSRQDVADTRRELRSEGNDRELAAQEAIRSQRAISDQSGGEGCGGFWKPEPSVGRVANGIPRRVDRLRGLGNAIVPQIAMQIGLTIKAVNDAL